MTLVDIVGGIVAMLPGSGDATLTINMSSHVVKYIQKVDTGSVFLKLRCCENHITHVSTIDDDVYTSEKICLRFTWFR